MPRAAASRECSAPDPFHEPPQVPAEVEHAVALVGPVFGAVVLDLRFVDDGGAGCAGMLAMRGGVVHVDHEALRVGSAHAPGAAQWNAEALRALPAAALADHDQRFTVGQL